MTHEKAHQQIAKRLLLSSIEDGASKGLRIDNGEHSLALFLVRRGDDIYCYRNRCPHTGVNLDWVPDQFLDLEGEHIQCATHGALFRIADGFCVAGPCAGESLAAVELKISGDYVDIVIPT